MEPLRQRVAGPTYEDKDLDTNFTNEREWGILPQTSRLLDLTYEAKTLTRITRMNANGRGFAGGRGGMINIKN